MKDLEFLKAGQSTQAATIDKYLCILEGKTELLFIKRLIEINENTSLDCPTLISKIMLMWGKEHPKKISASCDFSGGNQPNSPAPYPALESLTMKQRSLHIYKSVIIVFDADRDVNGTVYEQIINILRNYSHLKISLVYSSPCFERTLLDLIWNSNIEVEINSYQMSCQDYKTNFHTLTNLATDSTFTSDNSNEFIQKISNTELQSLDKSSQLNCLIDVI